MLYQRTYIFKQLHDTYRLFFHCQPLLVRHRPSPPHPPTHPLYDIRAIQVRRINVLMIKTKYTLQAYRGLDTGVPCADGSVQEPHIKVAKINRFL